MVLGLLIRAKRHFDFKSINFRKCRTIKKIPGIKSVKRNIRKSAEDGIFPDFMDKKASPLRNWNSDNYGPIYIPQAGKTVKLNKETFPFYKIIINDYEATNLKLLVMTFM